MSNPEKTIRRLGPSRETRLNPEGEAHYQELYNLLDGSPELLAQWITEDRAKREGYRNHSGRPPQLRSLLLRRALELGLAQLHAELLTESQAKTQPPPPEASPKVIPPEPREDSAPPRRRNRAEDLDKALRDALLVYKDQRIPITEITRRLEAQGLLNSRGKPYARQQIQRSMERLRADQPKPSEVLENLIKGYIDQGLRLSEMTRRLEAEGVLTNRGKPYGRQSVSRILKRLKNS